MSGKLYIVATPIGNLDDITLRAIKVLNLVDLVAAEDTRHSLKLLNHLGISKPLTSYFDHNSNQKDDKIISSLLDGKNIALISDAGTPCISDPGYTLVKKALENEVDIIPIPGACAAIAALSASGVSSDSFTFIALSA